MRPYRLSADDPSLGKVLALIQDSFAFMDGRVDPPSSAATLTVADLARTARQGEIWCLGQPVGACVALHLRPQTLYLGKLAVRQDLRGQGVRAVWWSTPFSGPGIMVGHGWNSRCGSS